MFVIVIKYFNKCSVILKNWNLSIPTNNRYIARSIYI